MKKIISIIMIVLVGLTIIPKTIINERHIVLESTTSVYTKEEIDNLLSAIRTNITNNTNELTNIKSELTALQNSLKDYALKTSLNTTNSNIDGLNTVVENNIARIEALENNSSNITLLATIEETSATYGEIAGKTLDISELKNNYTDLTEENFIIEIVSIKTYTCTEVDYKMEIIYSQTITKNYDANTGILTIDGLHGWRNDNNRIGYTNATVNVWLVS